MKYLSTITSQGQVTLPLKLRELFGMRPKDKVEFFESNGEIILKPAKSFLDLKGVLKGRESISPREMDEVLSKAIGEEYAKK